MLKTMHCRLGQHENSTFTEKCTDGKMNIDSQNTPLKTRLTGNSFDWKLQCFICGERCDPKRDKYNTSKGYSRSWSLVESSISADARNIYKKVVQAAQIRNDQNVLDRMYSLPNGDLVAVEARYHRKKGCLSSYYDLKRFSDFSTGNKPQSVYINAAEQLKKEYEHAIIVEKKVFYLSVLRKRFIEIGKEIGKTDVENYRSSYFKKLLGKIWPELSFLSQNGKSDLVCSSAKTLGETLKEAKTLEEIIQQENECSYDFDPEEETDEAVMHKAVGILRRRILANTSKLENEYFSGEEMSLSAQKEFVDPLLFKTVCWLSDRKLFASASESTDKKCLAIACDITNLVTSVPSPKHLGFAVHLYNDFGSRHLVDDMYGLGYSISYSELRMFLSSAANQAIKTQHITPSGGLVPDHIFPDEKRRLFVGVADNWDHNERTVDGKRTTHAMTSILVSSKSANDMPLPRLPRTPSRTFDSKSLPGGSLCSIIPYRKPANRPCPAFDPPVTADEIRPPEPNSVKQGYLKELLYAFGRCEVFCDDISEDTTKISHWSIFHADTCYQEDSDTISSITYNPIIMANPTEYSTIYTTLLRFKEVMNSLGQSYAPVVFDMSLLTKALEIVWYKKDELKGVIPMEGGMHMLMSVFAGIGYLFGEAGLRQLLTDSGLYASTTVSNILAGKDFDRALTAFKLIDEALHIRLLYNFEIWCEENDKVLPNTVYEMLSKLRRKSTESYSETDLTEFTNILSSEIVPLMNEFRNESREISATFKLWDDYITKVSTPLKMFISSTRAPNWTVHQYAKLMLMPLLFASNRSTYAKYIAVQVLQMNRIPTELRDGFAQGLFTSKLTEGKFNNVWMDYTLEVTQNKALKGSGGIIGLTLRENALARWFLARPLASRYSYIFHKNICCSESAAQDQKHHDNTKSRREQYDRSVDKLVTMFDRNFIDPFDVKKAPNKLVNFATGTFASDEVGSSLTESLIRGTELFEAFVSERLVEKADGSQPPVKNFFSPMPQSNIKTMSDIRKKTTAKKVSKESISGEVMFQRLLAINTYKKFHLNVYFPLKTQWFP